MIFPSISHLIAPAAVSVPDSGNMIFVARNFGGERLITMLGPGLGAEIFYSFVIIVCSLMIYFGTKELYDLSSYKGIKYFRQAFLFFAIAYFFRSFIKVILLYFMTGEAYFSPITFGITGILTQILFIYFSAMAIFYLLYSVMWKKWKKHPSMIYLFHGLAVVIALISALSGNPLAYLIIDLFLLLVVMFVVYVSYKNRSKRKGNNLYLIYLLLLIFWVLNIIDTLIPVFFQGFQIFIYMVSTLVFLLILYRVVKKTGSN